MSKRQRKNVRGRKRDTRKKKHRIRRGASAVLLSLLALTIAGGGYEYAKTGSISQTLEIIESIGSYAGRIPDLAEEAGSRIQDAGSLAEHTFRSWMGETGESVSLETIPQYQGEAYVTVEDNLPEFTAEELEGPAFESYSDLDALGRCGYAEAKITRELMPTEERGPIGEVRPSGWHTVKYDCVDGNYLYNRCHLIGYQLTGENANEKNLITGTRYMNVEGMLPWEDLVADYIEETGDAVLYRVTPVYEGDNLLASGVEMEAESVGSSEISFHIFVFNVQPGIGIDYATGDSWEEAS